MSKSIVLKNIGKKYFTHTNIKVLNDISFTFEKGKIPGVNLINDLDFVKKII